MLHRLPRQLPPLALMLDDIGRPRTADLARALGVTPRTARAWVAAGQAPRSAMLALFFLTRWGLSQADCDAHNAAQLARAHLSSVQEEKNALQAEFARVLALADTGAANGASWRALPMAAVIPFPGRAARSRRPPGPAAPG